jgi:hypothetical protein
MAVTLEKPLKREVSVGTEAYMLTIAPDGLKLVPKGKRIGVELRWEDLVSGQAALAVALNASIERLGDRDRPPRSRDQAPLAAQAPVAPATPAPSAQGPDVRRGRSKSTATAAPRARGRRRR